MDGICDKLSIAQVACDSKPLVNELLNLEHMFHSGDVIRKVKK